MITKETTEAAKAAIREFNLAESNEERGRYVVPYAMKVVTAYMLALEEKEEEAMHLGISRGVGEE